MRHPLVRTNDESGVQAIYFNPNRTIGVDGLDALESDALLDWLYDHMTEKRFQYAHEWRVGDVLIWDNCAVQHLATFDYKWPEERRLMWRITVGGTETR